MSTPGRKRVQPIMTEDEDDNTELTSNEILVSSSLSSSNIDIQDITPSLSTSIDIQQSIKKNLYVPLNFDELSHIRNVQTNSEFAILLYDFNLYRTVINGHICFSCRKVKFSLLHPSFRCAICLQHICSKCQRKINSRHDNICFVSLNLLRRSSTTISTSLTNNMIIKQNEKTYSELSPTVNKCKKLDKKKISNNSFICCIDCFILFDPSSIV
ncbi:unnamed protein product [Rotaria sp. Silwood1]|nr:unnamed protein product [Rotaria sp. Silwood1]CAF3428428.1 unnamed protein product [Rotaria sp. Silwood1]CAF3432913.1 unnamed protein product [Rotaria sp. Silwood1]CAF4745307.1 unnamed protein product [Rotaria sp. Silwood1]CAF4763190.1 unnamed protein product [Rotaria sp. Silwood1]